MTNLDGIFKSRDITLLTKVRLVKAMVFPAVMYGCESWTVKKAECQRIDAFELWCWRRLLRVPWTARRSTLGFLWKEWCWSWSSSTLDTSCEELTHWKRLWCWEGLGAGGEGDDQGWDGWIPSLTRWTWVWVNSGRWWWTGRPGVLRFMGSQRLGHDWVTELSYIDLCQISIIYRITIVKSFFILIPRSSSTVGLFLFLFTWLQVIYNCFFMHLIICDHITGNGIKIRDRINNIYL